MAVHAHLFFVLPLCGLIDFSRPLLRNPDLDL